MSFKKRGAHFLKEMAKLRTPPSVTSEFVEEFLEALDCPRSLTVAILYRNKEYSQLLELQVDPLWFDTPQGFRRAYVATEFLSKYTGFTGVYDTKALALEKFKLFELQCAYTNSRFRNLGSDHKYRGRVVSLHDAVIRKVRHILGEFNIHEFFDLPNWGPGVTTQLNASNASSANKFQFETGITRDLYELLPGAFEGAYPLWASHLTAGKKFPTFELGNRVTTVPKNAKIDRVIAIEPGFNLWFQLAVGRMIEARLRKVGVDISDQSRNMALALEASKSGLLATVDFSSASDSISYGIIEEIFTRGCTSRDDTLPRWFTVMNACRSPMGTLDGSIFRWSKFSSMGNGFTFPLETLLFYAIAYCAVEYAGGCQKNIGVYGDDVILPVSALDVFKELSEFYGFSINVKKSHYSSPFRESCGAHFYSGVDCKPVYFRKPLSDVRTVFRTANAIRRFAFRCNGNHYSCDASFRVVFNHLVALVPKPYQLWIPENRGDGGFVGNFDESLPIRARFHIEGYFFVHLTEVPFGHQSEDMGALLARLWVRSHIKGGNFFPLRTRTRLRLSRSLVGQWRDLGPWL